ncbi:MAG: hypothetical protein EOO96_09540 [Pedobacter sp.]|nr:MAG: hypothetical protein EOO96_09540 [Pedobacter sp.]
MQNQFLFCLFLPLSLGACGQTNTHSNDKKNTKPNVMDTTYTISNYQFNPSKRIVAVLQYFSKGKVGTSMGYFPDTSIKYDSTTLVVLGNEIVFKEHFPKEVDFSSLHYIGESDYSISLFSDKQYIYAYSPNFLPYQGAAKKVDISAYTRINDYIYENIIGELCFLNVTNGLKLVKIEGLPNLDKQTLKHVQGQYFTDKNGLYAFGVHYFGHMYSNNYSSKPISILVESSNGKIIKPIITRNYIVYGKSVYAKNHSIERLKLDVNKMMEIKWGTQHIYFVTDGTNLFENMHSSYREAEWNKDNHYANDFFKSGINILKIFSPLVSFLQASDKQTLYFGNIKKDKTAYTQKNGILIKTDQGYFFANNGRPNVKPEKIEKVIIYNETTKQNETFEEEQFLSIDERIFAYKGLIFINNIPLKEINGMNNLRFFTDKGIVTNFVTDGKTLVAFGNIGGYQTTKIDGSEKVVFEKWIKRDVTVANLRAINKNLLVDENNFYDCSNGSLQIIPFKKLGMPVKLLLPTEPMQYDFR